MGAVSSTITTTKESVLQLNLRNNLSVYKSVGGRLDFRDSNFPIENTRFRRVGGRPTSSGSGFGGNGDGSIQNGGKASKRAEASIALGSRKGTIDKKAPEREPHGGVGRRTVTNTFDTTITTIASPHTLRPDFDEDGFVSPPPTRPGASSALIAEQQRVSKRYSTCTSNQNKPESSTSLSGHVKSDNVSVHLGNVSKPPADSFRASRHQHTEEGTRGGGGGSSQKGKSSTTDKMTAARIGSVLSKFPLSRLKIVIGKSVNWSSHRCPHTKRQHLVEIVIIIYERHGKPWLF